jgi:site-specific recombinase XerD
MAKHTCSRLAITRNAEWFAAAGLEEKAKAYTQYLTNKGYSTGSIETYSRSAAHFVHWFAQHRVRPAQVDEALIQRFLDRHLPNCRCHLLKPFLRATYSVRPALKHLLAMLRTEGLCLPRRPSDSRAVGGELNAFKRHLIEVRGLCESTCMTQVHHVRDFLTDRFGEGPIQISMLTPSDVARFIRRYTAGWAPASIKSAGISLRQYFLFKASQGESTRSLIAALPRVAQWRLVGLPDVLTAAETHRLLRAFDRHSRTGRRDYAIARCLIDLGLRRTEVAHLRLEDVDWRAGTLSIHGKGRRIDTVPLPQHTGKAIADYLRQGRPQTTRREIFVRHRPPINSAADLDIIRNAVRNAAARCGLETRVRGTHIFRYTVACRMVQAGAPFKEIADLLRHRSLDTTTIYAKVDLPSLAQVALPWPGRRV